MKIAINNNQLIKAEKFVKEFGINHNQQPKCVLCDNELFIRNRTNDKPYIFVHHKNSECTSINKNHKPFEKLKKNKLHNNELQELLINSHKDLLKIYAICSTLVGYYISAKGFSKLLVLANEYKIWDLQDANIETIPYMLVMLSEFSSEKYENNKVITFIKKKKSNITRHKNMFNNFYLMKQLNGQYNKSYSIPVTQDGFQDKVNKILKWTKGKKIEKFIINQAILIL